MTKSTILLVEDNEALRETVGENLESDGYKIITAANAEELLTCLKTVSADTILLDLVLPDADGLSLIAKIREYTEAPVIVVSGKGGMVDKVVGLEMGADDYIAKPFEMRELTARIKASVRRYKAQRSVVKRVGNENSADNGIVRIKFGSLVLDQAQFQVFDAAGRSLNLTIMEYRLLEALVMTPNRVLSREQLLDKARQDNPDIYDRAIDVQIARIRKKIGCSAEANELIRTVRGAGYMFVAQTETIE